MHALNQYYAHHDPGYFRQAMIEAQQHTARLAHIQLAALDGLHATLDTLAQEVADARRTAAQGLAIQQAILARELFQDRMEEFVYQFVKMLGAFADTDEYPPSTQFFLLAGVFAAVERDGITTAVIRGRDNKVHFDDCLTRGRQLWTRLIEHTEVIEAVAWAEAENRRQEALAAAERDRAAAERLREQERGREKLGTTIGAILLAMNKFMPMGRCYLKPNIPEKTLRTAVAAFGIRQEDTVVGPVRPEDGVLGVFDITVLGSATDGLLVGTTGLYYRNQSTLAGKYKSGPMRVPYDQLIRMTITKEGTLTPLLAFDGRYYLHCFSHGWRTTLFDIVTAVREVVDRVESSWASGRPELALRWFVQREGKDQIGPFSDADLAERARVGKLRPTDLVRNGGAPGWQSAAVLRVLFPAGAG